MLIFVFKLPIMSDRFFSLYRGSSGRLGDLLADLYGESRSFMVGCVCILLYRGIVS